MPANYLSDDVELLRSHIVALEQLLEVREQAVRHQSERLENALGELRQRAVQLEQSEQALRNQTSILQSILNSMGDGVVVVDEQGRFILFNPGAERIMGKGVLQSTPAQWTEQYGLYLPDQVTPYPTEELPLVRAIRGEEVDDVEVFMRHAARPGGLWVSVNARPLRDEQGQPHGGVAVVHDITQRKRIEEALRNSEALYQSLVESLPLSVFRKDLQGCFIFANTRFCATLSRPLEEILGRNDRAFYPAELAAKYEHDDRTVIETGAIFEDIEDHQRADGVRISVQVLKVPIYDFQGNIVGTQGLFWDVTARKQAEVNLKRLAQELERSNEELKQFAQVVSHDLHEPLRMVSSYCRLLQRRYQGRLDPAADEFIAYALDGATRMQELLDDLLAYTRVGTQGKPLAATDCSGVLHSVLANLKLSIEESGAVVTYEPLPTVLADAPQLVQLLQNLVANAIKFRSTEPPLIHVSARLQGAHWLFAVRDNGIGMDPDDAERIFVIFQRLHTRREYAGTGIGLAICKKIVERHHGRIWVESHPGQGSVFYFTFPDVNKPGQESKAGQSPLHDRV
jgi:PAS domain S-box-containing protein